MEVESVYGGLKTSHSQTDFYNDENMNWDFTVALVYNFTSVYTNIASCRRDESKTSFPLQEEILVYSRVFV